MTGIKLAILSGQNLLQELTRAIWPGPQNSLDIVPANITGFTVSVTVFAWLINI